MTVPIGGGRINARPGAVFQTTQAGLFDLPENGANGTGKYFVPSTYNVQQAIPMVILFHGAGQRTTSIMTPMSLLAEEMGIALFAINSNSNSWDVIEFGTYGADVKFLNFALPSMFRRVNVDPLRVGMAGFSDGASFALSLGLGNGDLVSRVAAFSPGGIANGALPVGKPEFFITHGTRDQVLPIQLTRLNIMPFLQAGSYKVELHEFDGTHEIPPDLMRDAAAWLRTR